jgi:hypothetical protein
VNALSEGTDADSVIAATSILKTIRERLEKEDE